MKAEIKKGAHDAAAQETFYSTKARKKGQNVKTVAIFMDNLDKQLDSSYARLRKNREKVMSNKKESTFGDETLPCAESSILPKTEQPRVNPLLYESYRSPPHQHSPNTPDRSEIVLLDNKEVMEYIHLVYDIYNIKDPMQREQTESDRNCMTNKKIRNFKDNFQKEIGSASTMKHSHLHKSIELNPFSDGRKSQIKKETTTAAKIEIISLQAKNQSRYASKEKEDSESSDKSSTYRFKNQNVLDQKQKINITSSHRAHTQTSAGVSSIPQLFRFCFMCEQPILEFNLLSHEKACESLKEALHKNFEELLSILDSKINYLIEEINFLLLEKTEERIKEQFAMIKKSVKNWLAKLPPDSLTRLSHAKPEPQIKLYNSNWRGEFNKIQQTISRSACSSFQLIHKLQWFSKLRQNIALQYFPLR